MGLKRVLTPRKHSKLVVTAGQSVRNIGLPDLPNLDEEPDDKSSPAGLPTNDNLSPQRHKSQSGLGLADNFGVELAIVVGSAIFFRKFWMLHGIHFIVLRRTLRLAIAWMDYFLDSGIYEEAKRTALYIFRYVMKNTDKALSGDSMRLFFAASWLQNYKTWGYQIWFSVLRRQYRHVNKLELNEQEDSLQTTEMLTELRKEQEDQ